MHVVADVGQKIHYRRARRDGCQDQILACPSWKARFNAAFNIVKTRLALARRARVASSPSVACAFE
jgi:hypothetical protein